MTQASKVTIATSVLAGLALSDRLQELGIVDEQVHDQVGKLAASLAEVMVAVEKVDQAIGLISEASQKGDTFNVDRGLSVVRRVTTNLIADQDQIEAAFMKGASPEEILLMKLMAALSGR